MMMTCNAASAMVALWLGGAIPAAPNPAPAEDATSPLAVSIEQDVLPNGLQVITVAQHRAPVVSVQLWVHAGSRNERPGITGISHLFEHMMFKGSRRYGPEQHARQVQAGGGRLNAYTTQDHTTYYDDFSSENLELAFVLEADRFTSLRLNDKNLQTEREVVKEERRLRIENSPNGRVFETFMASAFQAHAYRWPVLGWMSNLDGITLADCKDYFRRYYAPNNTVLVVAGDATHAEVMNLARKHFGRWKRQPRPPPVVTTEPEQSGEKRIMLRHPAQTPIMLGGWHIPPYNHVDIAALEVAGRILSDGHSSRLYQRLVYKDQVALAAVGGVLAMEDPGVFYAYASVKPDKDPAVVERSFMQEVERLKNQPVEAAELAKAQNQLEASFVMGLKRVHGMASQVGKDALLAGDPTRINKRIPAWRAVTAADVQRVARTYFTVENRTVVVLVPTEAQPAAAGGGQP